MATHRREPLRPGMAQGSDLRPEEYVVLPSDLDCWPVVKEMLSELQGRLINENISDQVIGVGWAYKLARLYIFSYSLKKSTLHLIDICFVVQKQLPR